LRVREWLLVAALVAASPGAAVAAGDESRRSPAEWTMAAESGDADAQVYLGNRYHYGRDVPRDLALAVAWWQKAAAQGQPSAQARLGDAHLYGRGVAPDPVAAARWYRLAAEQGLSSAQASLGDLYAEGRGVPEDDVEALRWYRLAAGQFDAAGQYALGEMYTTGQGVAADLAEANRWYSLAADSGFTAAQLELGRSYETGRGRPKDLACAWFWYGLAERLGWEFAGEQRAALEPRLSAAELAEGRRLLDRTTVPAPPEEGPVQRPLCADETVSLDLQNASLEDVLQVFEQLSGRRIVLEERVERKVAIQIQDVAWPKALTDLLAPLGLRWFAEGEVLRVVRAAELSIP